MHTHIVLNNLLPYHWDWSRMEFLGVFLKNERASSLQPNTIYRKNNKLKPSVPSKESWIRVAWSIQSSTCCTNPIADLYTHLLWQWKVHPCLFYFSSLLCFPPPPPPLILQVTEGFLCDSHSMRAILLMKNGIHLLVEFMIWGGN